MSNRAELELSRAILREVRKHYLEEVADHVAWANEPYATPADSLNKLSQFILRNGSAAEIDHWTACLSDFSITVSPEGELFGPDFESAGTIALLQNFCPEKYLDLKKALLLSEEERNLLKNVLPKRSTDLIRIKDQLS